MSLRDARWFAEDMVKLGRWLVRESRDELHSRFWKAVEGVDSRLAPKHVQQGWDGFLAEEEASREVWEPGEASLLSWGVDGATTEPAPGEMCDCGHTAYVHSASGCHADEHYVMSPCDCVKFTVDLDPTVLSAASADDVPPSSVADEGPSEVCGDPPPPSEGLPLADLIAEVLAEHWARPCYSWGYVNCFCGLGHSQSHEQWRAHVAPLIAARVEKQLRSEQVAFAARLGFGDNIVEPAATLAEMVDPIEQAFSDGREHQECPRMCENCGERLATTLCPDCRGSGCGPGTASGAYSECELCAGSGWLHDGCVGQTYADLVAELQHVRDGAQTLGRIIHRMQRDILDITGLHHLIDESGDGQWDVVWETLAERASTARIEKATLPAPFTHGDLIEAAHVINAYSARMEACGASMGIERALAGRLADAGHADPNP